MLGTKEKSSKRGKKLGLKEDEAGKASIWHPPEIAVARAMQAQKDADAEQAEQSKAQKKAKSRESKERSEREKVQAKISIGLE